MSESFCRKCGLPNPSTVEYCNRCGEKLTPRPWLLIIGSVVIVIFVLALFVRHRSPVPGVGHAMTNTAPPAAQNSCLLVSTDKGSYDDFSTTITGTIQNTCGKKFRAIEVSYKLFDDSGAVVGNAVADLGSVDGDQPWGFTARGWKPAKRFLLDKVTAN
jgi:hypothetical protein